MTGRRLVQRSHLNTESPVQSSRHQRSENDRRLPATLPPYQPLSCPISADAKRKLEELYLHQDYSKYKKNLKDAAQIITKATYECNDRLWQRKQKVQSTEDKIKASEAPANSKRQERYEKEKEYADSLEKTVQDLTSQAEEAVRELIDYGDELSKQSRLLQEVSNKVASPDPSQVGTGTGCVEILRAAKENHAAQYRRKSMAERYADHNDYKNFKGMIHDAQNQGPNALPLPDSKYWFSGENPSQPGISGAGRQNADDEDDEIVMTGATTSLKCTFTLQYFEEPYSNKKCKHTYEKSAILDYIKSEGVAYSQSGRRGQPRGPKIITCPTPGCSAALAPDDFFLDERIRQQVIKAKRLEANASEADDSDDEAPRGTRRTRSGVHVNLDDDDNEGDEDTFVVDGDE
ncbi:hypothetical protein K3495_g14198 [Podosphaera aphanis]|nr:hypothetical protein K3495_g14198 [Podosphaera aphanis]